MRLFGANRAWLHRTILVGQLQVARTVVVRPSGVIVDLPSGAVRRKPPLEHVVRREPYRSGTGDGLDAPRLPRCAIVEVLNTIEGGVRVRVYYDRLGYRQVGFYAHDPDEHGWMVISRRLTRGKLPSM